MARAMYRVRIRRKDYYFEWSTIVDAPVSWVMNAEEAREYISSKSCSIATMDR